MILPIRKLVESINPTLTYTITDLADKCLDSRMFIRRESIARAVRDGKLEYAQPGGVYNLRIVSGQDFIDWVLTK